MAFDPNTVLLLHGDAASYPSTTILDSSGRGHAQTVTGGAVANSTQPKFGTGSLEFNGSSAYINLDGSSDFSFGTGDFTIDFWFRFAALNQCLLVEFRTSSSVYQPGIMLMSGKLLYFNNGANIVPGTTTIAVNTWYHLAVVRQSGTSKMYLNGVQEGSAGSDSTAVTCPAARPVIGVDYTGAGNFFCGWIDELRFSKVARWTSNFTPPSVPYDTTVYLVGGTTWTKPFDWNDASNSVICIGGGGNGGTTINNNPYAGGGGGGGAIAQSFNLSGLPSSVPINVGGVAGDTWFNSASFPSSGQACGAKGGLNGSGSQTAGTGGSAASSYATGTGNIKNSGGTGGTGGSVNGGASGGGGGAAGSLTGVGGNGTAGFSAGGVIQPVSGGDGGSSPGGGGGGSGFYGGPTAGGNGAQGTGGGGGGGYLDAGFTGFGGLAGGLYGGGGGGGSNQPQAPTSGGAGKAGLIIVTYTPTVPVTVVPLAASDLVPLSSPTLGDQLMLLLHCDGANGTTSFPDASGNGHTVTRGGATQVATGQSKFGGAAALFDGATSTMNLDGSSDFAFGLGDFTIDLWVFTTTASTTQVIYDARSTGATEPTVVLYVQGSVLQYFTNGAGRISGTTALVNNTWYHVALVRSAGVTKFYLNGAQEGASYADANNYINPASRPGIGYVPYSPSAYWNGYLDEIRISKNARWTANFTPPTGPAANGKPSLGLPSVNNNDGNTVLLLHGDGPSGSITFPDSSGKGHVVTNGGGCSVNPSYAKFGGRSIYVNGSATGYLQLDGSADFAFGAGDFSIDMWVFLFSYGSGNPMLFDFRPSGTQVGPYPTVYIATASPNNINVNIANNVTVVSGATTIPLNTWTHVAITRSGGTVRLFVNGVLDGSGVDPTILSVGASTRPLFGMNAYNPGNSLLQAMVEEIRVSKGVARWTTNFTPPVAPYPPYAFQALGLGSGAPTFLLHCDGPNNSTTFVDTALGQTVTVTGTAKISTAKSKWGGSSAAFDGTANCSISAPASYNFAPGINEFTFETWVNFNALPATSGSIHTIVDLSGTTGDGSPWLFAYNNGTSVVLYVQRQGQTNIILGTTALAVNTWYHVALCRAGTTTRLFLNGVLEGPAFTGDTQNYSSGSFLLGKDRPGTYGCLNGYLDEILYTLEAKYSANFTPPRAPYLQPYLGQAWPMQGIDANTVLLLHCDGFNGSTTIPDTSGRNHPVTLSGSVALSTAQEEFGSASALFASSLTGYLTLDGSSDFTFGTGDFTIEMWINPVTLPGPPSPRNAIFYDTRGTGEASGSGFIFYVNSAGVFPVLAVLGSAALTQVIIGSTPVVVGAWQHVALVRSAGVLSLYLNGQLEGSYSDATNYSVLAGNRPLLGCNGANAPGSLSGLFNGYMDEVRVSKGVARWTAPFNPPNAPLGYLFSSSSLASSSPALGTPVMGGTMAGVPLVPSSPVLGAPAMTHFFLLAASNLTTSSPVLGLGYSIGVLSATSLATSSPVVPVDPVLRQMPQILHGADLVNASPELGKPGRLPQPLPVYPADMDRHVRRTGQDYASALIDLLPRGQAWPRHPESTLIRSIVGLASYYGFVDSRAADLLETESDPRATVELLPDWERNWGLPDPCFKETKTIAERQQMLVMKMTLMGGQSKDFFYSVAQWMGWTIHIEEFSPFMAGISQVGDTRALTNDGTYRWQIGPPEMRFYWVIHHNQASLTWFRASQGQAGVDPHLRIGTGVDMDCLFRRWKPAHSDIVYRYDNLENGNPMEGTP